MAVNDVKAANVTKYDAGGSGDDYIPDGYIKSVEKVWQDNYTLTSVITLTNTSIIIARIPTNKKITSIDVIIETTASHTSGTIALGTSADEAQFLAETNIAHNLTTTTITFPGAVSGAGVLATGQTTMKLGGMQFVTNGTTGDITLKLNNWTQSTGTVKTIVRYT